MAARLKRDVECSTSRLFAGCIERENFSVRLAGAVMISLADDAAFRDDHRSDHRVRTRAPAAPCRKAKRSSHVEAIEIGGIHRVLREADLPPGERRACVAFTDRLGMLAFPFLLTRLGAVDRGDGFFFPAGMALSAACAAASRAIGTRNGEQLT